MALCANRGASPGIIPSSPRGWLHDSFVDRGFEVDGFSHRRGRLASFAAMAELLEGVDRMNEQAPCSGPLDFLGMRDDIPDLIAGADIFVIPSRALAEALSVLSGDPCLRARMGRAGQDRVTPDGWLPHRTCLYMSSSSSSYMASARSGSSLRRAWAAQCFRWFRISSRPTPRSASWAEAIWVMMSAQ
jgi:hypothetical protein